MLPFHHGTDQEQLVQKHRHHWRKSFRFLRRMADAQRARNLQKEQLYKYDKI